MRDLAIAFGRASCPWIISINGVLKLASDGNYCIQDGSHTVTALLEMKAELDRCDAEEINKNDISPTGHPTTQKSRKAKGVGMANILHMFPAGRIRRGWELNVLLEACWGQPGACFLLGSVGRLEEHL